MEKLFKFKLTPEGEELNNKVSVKFEEDEELEYESLSSEEALIADVAMYSYGLYADIEFNNLEEWVSELAEEEYEDSEKGKEEVLNKINTAIEKGWAVIEKIEE